MVEIACSQPRPAHRPTDAKIVAKRFLNAGVDLPIACPIPSVTLPCEMIISKATSVYVIMMVVLVGGLWLIMEMGSTLVPPTDLAGKWELASPAGAQELWVEQSGKFVNLVMGNWTADLKIERDGNQNPTQGHGILIQGKNQTVDFDGLGISDQCTIHFDGAMKGVFQARRVYRAFH
jgi:hypothetical protein